MRLLRAGRPAHRRQPRRPPAIPVHLRAVLGNLDARNITMVAAAITTANGEPGPSVSRRTG